MAQKKPRIKPQPNVVRRPCCGAIVPARSLFEGAVRVRHKGGCRG